jgi:trigger factor
VKSAVETLNPTRVRLTVEVPFEELKPSVDEAYKKIASQVSIPGFRKGKVPARLIDQRFGRGVVLEEAVNDALPRFYSQAVQEHSVQVLGAPEVDVTEVPDPTAGGELKFSAEVDVRPEIELPEYDGLEVTVDDLEVGDTEIDEQVENLRERFGILRGVERAAADGDFVSIDLAATVDGEAVEELTAKGLSHQVGSGTLLEGLDAAIGGVSAGESATFTTTLVGGDLAGRDAEVSVTVGSVKERELPELDDDFAQTASEFDTLDELRADLRGRLERMKRMQQGVDARDKALEALLGKVDVPLPQGVVKGEVDGRMHDLAHQLEAAGLTKADYLESEGQTEQDFDAEVEQRAREAIKAQFVLDAIAAKEKLSVSEQELSEHLVRRAVRVGMNPDEFAQQVVAAGQVPVLVSEVVRGKALAHVLEHAKVTDASGRSVDLEALTGNGAASDRAGSAEAGETTAAVETADADSAEA